MQQDPKAGRSLVNNCGFLGQT